METDRSEPFLALRRSSRSVCLAYTPEEFAYSLRSDRGGRSSGLDGTASVGIDGVAKAFADLRQPGSAYKIIVEPWR